MEKGNQSDLNERQQNFTLPTPEKPSETYGSKCKKEAVLPQKYMNLSEFFDRMTSSLRLLALCKKPPTFKNISRQVEVLTGRTFEHKHLAQIKHILPEAVNIDKILVHDQESLCMKPEMKITLTFDIVENSHEESVFIALGHLFSFRLRSFVNKHSEDCDVSEAILPVTYKKIAATISTEPLPVDGLTSTRTEVVKLSHFSPTYTPRFVERDIESASERIQLTDNPLPIPSSLIGNEIADEKKIASKPTLTENPADSSPRHVSSSTVNATPLKFVIESNKLMLETPAQSTPKRSSSTSEVKHTPLLTQTCMSCNQPAKRSLDFSILEEEEESSLNLTSGEADKTAEAFTEMETKGKTTSLPPTSSFQAKVGICLSELVTAIQKIFLSVNRRAMTKEELFHKIIMSCEYDEEGEIEEQIETLEKHVPGWICKKMALSGDLLYSIEKVPDVNSVLEAVTNI